MVRIWAFFGALNAFIAVGAGAFGAHALKARLTPERLATFEVGARYQMYHALALFAVAFLATQGLVVRGAGVAFLIGIVLFSGSLYALALTGVTRLGVVTPFGGLGFLVGWALVALACARLQTQAPVRG